MFREIFDTVRAGIYGGFAAAALINLAGLAITTAHAAVAVNPMAQLSLHTLLVICQS